MDFLRDLDRLWDQRRQAIRSAPDRLQIAGTPYYVSAAGNDANDGLTPESPWRTLNKVSSAPLQPGDGVLFARGDLFRGTVKTRPGVTYGAYGDGPKPRLYGWDRNLADPALWQPYDRQHSIWVLTEKILDPGTLVFEDGVCCSRKLIPSYKNGQFLCRDDETRVFHVEQEMRQDLDLYWHFDEILTTAASKGEDFPIPEINEHSLGQLYLRCDRGNPGEVFVSIEALTRRPMFCVGSNDHVRIDNLCMKFIGHHAVSAGGKCVTGLHVTNCEIGWIGGTIQHYFGTDPNYPQGGRGTVTRFGNGVEIYGGCRDYEVSGCYIYQVYDAGITHQITTCGRKRILSDILYKDNLVENCVYSIEYFLDMTEGDRESSMERIDIRGNILRRCGYGWGQQRHNTDTPAHIKGWSYCNRARQFQIRDNIFDRSAYRMLHLVAQEDAYCPQMQGNTYIQDRGALLGQYGGNGQGEPALLPFDEQAEEHIRRVFGDNDPKVFITD